MVFPNICLFYTKICSSLRSTKKNAACWSLRQFFLNFGYSELDNSQAWMCIQAWLLFYSKRFGSVPLPFSSNLFCYMQVLLLSNV